MIPLTSDIYLRITGPGGAVSYLAQRFKAARDFRDINFAKDPARGPFLPPRVRDRKLCASTHRIRVGDAPELQKWRGRTLAITVYGDRVSRVFCAALGPWLYLSGS